MVDTQDANPSLNNRVFSSKSRRNIRGAVSRISYKSNHANTNLKQPTLMVVDFVFHMITMMVVFYSGNVIFDPSRAKVPFTFSEAKQQDINNQS